MTFYVRHGLPKRIRLMRQWWYWSKQLIELAWQFEFCGTRQRLNDSIRSRKPDYG